MKITCTRCKEEKEIEDFPKRKGKFRNPCKSCSNELSRIAKRKTRKENVKEEKLKRMLYLSSNSDKIKEVRNSYRRNKYKTDEAYNIEHRFRSRLNKVTRNLGSKNNSSIYYLGCSREEFKAYIESKFRDGMNWNNRSLWHIDHIIPCSMFNLSLESELLKCFNYTNLQPLWAEDNLKKRNFLQKA